ncbi:MAG: hypothetical protein U9Q97_04765 [Acidobacteriota bacterium]|nr:hypothetical protein [Acidobacteriota bacterium]
MIKTFEETLAKYIENSGNKPYAFICNKETFKKIALELRELDIFKENKKVVPTELFFNGIPVFGFDGYPKDKIYIIDEKTFLKIRKDKKFLWEK